MTKRKDVVLEIETEGAGAEVPKPTVEKVERPPKDFEEALKRYLPGLLDKISQVDVTFTCQVPYLGAAQLHIMAPRAEAVDTAVWLSEVAAQFIRQLEPAIARAREQDEERQRVADERLRLAAEKWDREHPRSVGSYGSAVVTDCAERGTPTAARQEPGHQ